MGVTLKIFSPDKLNKPCINCGRVTTVKLSPHWSPHSSSHSSPHSPHIRPTFIMRLYKQIKTTCGTLTISNHSKSLYLYIKLLAFKILSILVPEAIIITAVATYTLKVKIKKLPFLGTNFLHVSLQLKCQSL